MKFCHRICDRAALPALIGLVLLGATHLAPAAPAIISGRVTSGGVAVPNVQVVGFGFDGGGGARTDSSGNYSFSTPGQAFGYTVTPSKPDVIFSPDSVLVPVAPNTPGVNFAVVSGPLRGRVTLSGAGVADVTVSQSGGRLVSGHGVTIPNININGITVNNHCPLRGTIRDVAVGIQIIHDTIGDLEVTLIHPDGTERRLHNRSGGDADNIGYVYYSSSGAGPGVPTDDLRVLNGKPPEGNWQLRVRDLAGASVGQLIWFDLAITTDTVTDGNGAYDLGSFRLFDLGSLLFTPTLSVARPGWTFSPPSQGAVPGVDKHFTVSGAPISGRVLTQNRFGIDLPVPNAGLNFVPGGVVVSDANGTYSFPAAPGISYQVGLISLTVGSQDVAFQPFPPFASLTAGMLNVDFYVVESAPVIGPIADLQMPEDTSRVVPFTLTDLQTAADALTPQVSSSNPSLLSGLVLGGSGANRTLTITPRVKAFGSATVTIQVHDGVYPATRSFQVNVTPVNDAPVTGPLTGVRLDGADEYVWTPSIGPSLAGNAAHTLEMWVRPDPLHPGVFASDFESGNPPGMTFYYSASVSGGYLRLTPAQGFQAGVVFINDFGGGAPVNRFTASFKLAVFGGSTPPADGLSFNLVPAAAVTSPPGYNTYEEGFPQGLAVNFDTFDNGGEAPAIEVKWLGNVLARVPYQVSAAVSDPAAAARAVLIHLDPDATLDVSYGGQRLIHNLPTPYNPATIGTPRWVLAARTGPAVDNHWIDDLRIEAPALTPPTARRTIVTLGDTSGLGAHYWQIRAGTDPNNPLLECGIAGGSVLVPGLPLPAERWTHIAATWDQTSYKVFLNGVQAGTGSGTFNLTGVPLALGRGFNGAANFRGNLDEVRLWSAALTEPDINSYFRYPLKGTEANLQVYHRFDEATGPIVADSAPFRVNSDGELRGGATFGLAAGARAAGSLRLDGVDDYVRVPNFGPVAPTSEATVEFWQKVSAVKAQTTFSLGPQADNNRFNAHVPWSDGVVYWDFGDWLGIGRLTYTPPPNSTVGVWQHWALVASQSGNYMRIFLNGAQVAQKPGMTPRTTAGTENWELKIGAAEIVGTFLCGAEIDEFRIWNIARSPAQIQNGWTNSLVGNEPGLIAYYRFDEGSGPVVADGAGGNNFGILTGNPTWSESARSPTNAPTGFGIATVNEDLPKLIFLPAFDMEQHQGNSSLTFAIVTVPAHGTVAPTSGTWANAAHNPVLYTPATNYTGPDSITFRVTDGTSAVSGDYTVPILVQAANDPPTISTIRDLVIEENTQSPEIIFTVNDADTSLSDLIITVESQDHTILRPADVQITGLSNSRRMVIRPPSNAVGTVTMVIRVNDRIVSADPPATFKVRVVPRPAYAILNLGSLTGYAQSFGRGLNSFAWVAGAMRSPPSDAHSFLFRGIEGPAGLLDLNTLGGLGAEANALNDLNFVTGVSTLANGQRQAFRWRNGTMTEVGLFTGGTFSEGRAINNNGWIAGVATTAAGVTNAFLHGGAMTNLGALVAGGSSEAFGINNAGEVVGYSTVAGGRDAAFLYRNGSMINLSVQANTASRAHAINKTTQIAGYLQDAAGVRRAGIFDWGAGQEVFRHFGILPSGKFSVAYGINDFGQAVGQGGDALDRNSAFLWSAERLNDLNDLVSNEDAELWRLQDARSINNDGFIAGTGLLNGSGGGTRAFLGVPAWVIGRPIPRPEGAVTLKPEIEVLSGPGDPNNSFFWSTVEKRLYAIRPVTARLGWFVEDTVTGAPINTNRIVTVGVAIWPRQPTLHVANTPTDIEPDVEGFAYSFQQVIYDPEQAVAVEPSTKRFTASKPGYAVLHYLRTEGNNPNPASHPPVFDVVRTIQWNDSRFLTSSNAVVGDAIRHPNHFDYGGRNGFVYFPRTFVDSSGPDRAYDRDSRRGAIIPVNTPTDRTATENDPLVVVWYRLNGLGVAWSSTPVRYSLNWPASAPPIIIASALGSGPLDPVLYPDGRLYNQPVRSLPGYNPNEEHALLGSASAGQVVYALRDDLNWEDPGRTRAKVSPPFVLFKYRDPTSDEWRILPFKVLAEGLAYDGRNYTFSYPGTAGAVLDPPPPLNNLTLCGQSYGLPGAGPWWEDVKGKIYARAAGLEGGTTNILLRWFYPLQPGFSYDDAFDGINDAPDGTCLAWLDRSVSHSPSGNPGTPGTPINVTYNISWPEAPVLRIGQTLLDAQNDLPDILSKAAIRMIYDDLNPFDTAPLGALARFYDPVSARTVHLPAGFVWPASVARQNISGKEYFPDLPYALKQRLYHDPVNGTLTFQGVLKLNFSRGQNPHLLLANVISPRERERILALAPGHAGWNSVVGALYQLTRNPNSVDMDGNGSPDAELRLGLTNITVTVTGFTNITILGISIPILIPTLTTITLTLPEQFGDGPKALTAALGNVPPPPARPGYALAFGSATSAVDLGPGVSVGGTFTEEAWIYPQPTVATNYYGILGHDPGQAIHRAPSLWIHDLRRVSYGFGDGTSFREGESAPVLQMTAWNHLAASFNGAVYRIYVNGFLVHTDTNFAGRIPAATPVRYLGERAGRHASFPGRMDEVRLWNVARTGAEIAATMRKRLQGFEDGLVGLWRCDEGAGSTVSDASELQRPGTLNGVTFVDLRTVPEANWGLPPRYITLAENDAPNLPGLPVQLHVIRVDDGPYPGDLKMLPSDNVFDERVSLRHSSDFGGAPERLAFQWYYKADETDFDATALPLIDPTSGDILSGQERGWSLYPVAGDGVNDVTLGEGGEPSKVTLEDNWFICRYRGYNVNGNTSWSNWIGQEEGRAQLVEGWIKRVIHGLNQFDARTDDFHAAPANTYASMLIQAGRRFEGPISFNPAADNLNQLGLIESYSTVFERGRNLSINGVPPLNSDAANNALLLVVSRIADLYLLLGNEAYADAQDPTIGFGTASGEYGTTASSIFAFQNQLDSLLEEELALLRGLDNRGRSVSLPPTYNRLVWNFTLGDGEVAYRQAYNIGDQDFNGFIDEQDARVLYPQGHGDAWGHYLTAIKSYYYLLRHTNFTWKARSENISVAGAPVPVDFLDERKFARIAAAKARAGRDIVDLTYRNSYVEDPNGQWQGYKDTDPERAWGVDDWARRAQQGAYLDWLAGNAVLPSTDPNPAHTGIQKIDRQTVSELGEIAAQALDIQTKLDQADAGLNPIGIAKSAVPFDIDPTFLEVGSTAQIGRRAVQGLTQFDQILERAIKAVKNSLAVWDEANKATELLRRTQDSVDEFTKNVREQEFDYKNRLIELFGYPYAGDIGAGKTYRSGYDGPDLVHHMYISSRTVTGDTARPAASYKGLFRGSASGFVFSPTDQAYDPNATDTTIVNVEFPLSSGNWTFDAPATWGERRAPGELQLALSDLVQAENNLKLALQNYDGLIQDILAQVKLLTAQRGLNADRITILDDQKNEVKRLNDLILAAQRGEVSMRRISSVVTRVTEAIAIGIPKSIEVIKLIGDAARSMVTLASIGVSEGLETVADILQVEQTIQEQAKEQNDLQIAIRLQTAEQTFEVLQSVEELNHSVRNEISLRLELYNQAEVVQQTLARYLAKLAEGQRLLNELERFRRDTAAQVTEHRYEDMTFRIFRNDALQKYRASFDIAARYVYLAANAYDYDVNFLRTDQRAGARFLTEIVRQRNLGQLLDNEPVVGQPGLCDLLGRMVANWDVLKPQLGVSTPQIADTRFSLREEWFRIRGDTTDEAANASWREVLNKARVANLWDVPEFRRYCRPFAPELLGAQPAIVIRFPTTITFGLNYFGWPLAGGDSAYDPTQFSTKIARAGVWFSGSDGTQVSQTPRIYLVPVGMDIQRSPTGDTLGTREWRIIDQAVPPPFPIGASDLSAPGWIPMNDTLGGSFAQIRRYGSFGAKHDQGIYSEDDLTNDTRLIGRSAWNTQWLLIIPGGTLLFEPNQGLNVFVNTVNDIKIFFQTYSYAGN